MLKSRIPLGFSIFLCTFAIELVNNKFNQIKIDSLMKIKHFTGYGCVNAKKISKEVVHTINEWGEPIDATRLKIKVTGNHEWGLERGAWDVYGLWYWLARRFHKGCTDTDIMKIDIDSISFTECDYTFYIKKNN